MSYENKKGTMNHPFKAMAFVNNDERHPKHSILAILLGFLVAAAMTACGGGGGGAPSTPNTNETSAVIIGQAIKGPISNGTVTAYDLTSSGTKGSALGATTTDANGNYSLTLSYTGPALLEVTGGSYIDEASRQTVNVPTAPGSGLQAVLSNVATGSTIQAQITPLTSMAAARAQAMNGGLTLANIDAANQQVATHFGGIDILNTQPINPLLADSARGTTQIAVNYGLILAGLSEEAQTLGLADPFDLVRALAQDFSDGVFNGKSGSTPILLNGSAMNAATGTAGLSTGISDFSADISRNASGATVPSTLLASIANPTSSFTLGGTVSGLSGTMVLENNGADSLTISSNGAFTFAGAITTGNPYQVAVAAQPTGQTCSVTNGKGTAGSVNISNVAVSCVVVIVNVPTVTGLSQASAQAAIATAGLVVGTVSQTVSTSVAPGNVISASPAAGSSVVQGSAVNLVISSGLPSVTVPSVTGLDQAAAASAMTSASLVVGTVTQASSTTVAAGNVISVSPSAGSTLIQGSTVNLVISSGLPSVSVPSVTRLSQGAATFVITAAGLVVGTVTQANSTEVAAGNVISESPAAGSVVAQGSAVNLLISAGLPSVSAPLVTGLGLAAARSAITAAGLAVGTVTQASSATVAIGNVISASPAAGSTVLQGSAMNLVISSTFTALATTMTSTRYGHTATLLPNGQVLLTGGNNTINSTGTPFNTGELYEPVAQTFMGLTATMSSARTFHTATLLPNFQVLLSGGWNGSSDVNSAEVYDPTANTFTPLTATMTSAREGHTATRLPSGQVLITGGSIDGNPLDTAELYDPVAQTFTALTATMSSARVGHEASSLINGQVLITGGSIDGNPLDTAELYDPVTQTFTALTATMISARVGHTVTSLLSGQVLIIGGCSSCDARIALNATEMYDPTQNTFTPLTATTTIGRIGHTATLLPNGRVLIVGGFNGFLTVNTAEVYDAIPAPAENLDWTALAPMLEARDQFAGGVIDGKIYIFGGNGDPEGINLKTTEVYDPALNEWNGLASNEHNGGNGVEEISSAVLNGKLYVFGAYGSGTSNGVFNFVEEYDPATDAWRSLTPRPTTVAAATAVTYNGEVYLFGGYKDGTGQSNDAVEAYNPATNTWRTVTSTPGYIVGAAIAVIGDRAYMIGGLEENIDRTSFQLHSNVIAYDFVADQWITAGLGTMPNLVNNFVYSGAAPVINGKIILIGGARLGAASMAITEANFETADAVYAYDPASKEFTVLNALPQATHDYVAVALGDEIHLIGGMTNSASRVRTNAVWKGAATAAAQ